MTRLTFTTSTRRKKGIFVQHGRLTNLISEWAACKNRLHIVSDFAFFSPGALRQVKIGWKLKENVNTVRDTINWCIHHLMEFFGVWSGSYVEYGTGPLLQMLFIVALELKGCFIVISIIFLTPKAALYQGWI